MRNIDSLKNSSQFKEVYENGQSVANRLLVMYVLATDADELKLGISVSKKVGNSVIRHRVTRLIRESYISVKDKLPHGYRIVVIARVGTADKGLSDISDSLLHLLRKQRLVRHG